MCWFSIFFVVASSPNPSTSIFSGAKIVKNLQTTISAQNKFGVLSSNTEYLLLCGNLRKPSPITHNGQHRVESIQSCCERYIFINVECNSCNIHHQPYKPLLHILTRQQPIGYNAQRRCKRIPKGNGAICKGCQKPVGYCIISQVRR